MGEGYNLGAPGNNSVIMVTKSINTATTPPKNLSRPLPES